MLLLKEKCLLLKFYVDKNNNCPFDRWLKGLDRPLAMRVLTRLKRAQDGNLGDIKSCGLGVSELRCFFGGGIRIYLSITNENGIVLLGGSKTSQSRDISLAQSYWLDYLERQHEHE